MFEVSFFEERRYLAQTGQLYLDGLTPYLDRVWAAGPSFRAEPDVDERHLIEFTLVELEFKGGFGELLGHIEGTITSMVDQVLGSRRDDLELLRVDMERLRGQGTLQTDHLRGGRRTPGRVRGQVGGRPEERP